MYIGSMQTDTIHLILDIATIIFVIYCMAMISNIKDKLNQK